MANEMTKEQLLALESQLICPEGDFGIEVGKTMNESNIGMTLNSIGFLGLQNGHSVLELGHGNCGHLDKLLGFADNLRYVGLEISDTMQNEARRNNKENSTNQLVDFELYDGENIPYQNDFFDAIFSVNTIYFWQNPTKLIQEIERVLKPSGCCVLAYANKDFMCTLPFVGEKFKLFGRDEVEQLIQPSNLKIKAIKEVTEQVKSKTGEPVTRVYTMVKLHIAKNKHLGE